MGFVPPPHHRTHPAHRTKPRSAQSLCRGIHNIESIIDIIILYIYICVGNIRVAAWLLFGPARERTTMPFKRITIQLRSISNSFEGMVIYAPACMYVYYYYCIPM